MNKLWTFIEEKNWHAETKYRVAILILGTLCALAGLAAWLIVRIWVLSSLKWLFCFMGYPVVISWLVVFLYACNHELHDGKYGI